MSRYEFLKMHGAGNDFVMIEDMDGTFEPRGPVIAALCAQHTGIGADGLILLRPSGDADFSMRYFNRDGGEADMCGNGARCAARFASICGIADGEMEFSTPAGLVKAELTGAGVRIGIGDVRGLKLEVATRSGHAVGFAICGVPHALIVVDDADGWSAAEFDSTGAAVRWDPAFAPEGTNFNIASIRDKSHIRYRTYERGVEAETLACGTGAVAVTAICSALGLVDTPLTCETSGGDLLEVMLVPVAGGATGCSLLGPAVATFSGEFEYDDFRP